MCTVGLNETKAAELILDNQEPKEDIDASKAVHQVFKWVDKLFQEAETVQECKIRVAVAKFRNFFLFNAKVHLDRKAPKTRRQLVETLLE